MDRVDLNAPKRPVVDGTARPRTCRNIAIVAPAVHALVTPLFYIPPQVRPIPVGRQPLDGLLSPNMVAHDPAVIVMKELSPKVNRMVLD